MSQLRRQRPTASGPSSGRRYWPRRAHLKGGRGELKQTVECAVVMVSVDSQGKPMTVGSFRELDDKGEALAPDVKKCLAGQ